MMRLASRLVRLERRAMACRDSSFVGWPDSALLAVIAQCGEVPAVSPARQRAVEALSDDALIHALNQGIERTFGAAGLARLLVGEKP